MASSESDEDLVRSTLHGDEEAFSRLFDRYRVPVYSTSYRILQNAEAARDATQEIFIKLYRSLRTFDPRKSKFSTWLYRLAANHAIDSWRARRTRSETRLPDEPALAERLARESVMAEAIQSPQDRVESKEKIDEIRRCVEALPELQKKVFVLRYFQDLKLEEIAEMEDCSLGTVKTSLFRATQTIRRRLRRFGGMR